MSQRKMTKLSQRKKKQLWTSSVNLHVASKSVRSQLCFNVIAWIPHLQVTELVQKGVGTHSHPTTSLFLKKVKNKLTKTIV